MQYAIETNAVLDRELPGTFWDADCNALYYLTLRAADTGDPPLTSDFMVRLIVNAYIKQGILLKCSN